MDGSACASILHRHRQCQSPVFVGQGLTTTSIPTPYRPAPDYTHNEMQGRMHLIYCQITILLVVDLLSSSAYPMMTHTLLSPAVCPDSSYLPQLVRKKSQRECNRKRKENNLRGESKIKKAKVMKKTLGENFMPSKDTSKEPPLLG